MMKAIRLLAIFIVGHLIIGCASLQPATSVKKGTIENYRYACILPTNSLSSGTAAGQYYATAKTVNPADVINGILSKEGFIRLPELQPEFSSETLIVNYGESGRRSTGLGGYTIEVTIQFISVKTKELVCSCTAEGQGETEADDIRKAITRCLNELLPQRN